LGAQVGREQQYAHGGFSATSHYRF
jgi:hypothetical protein